MQGQALTCAAARLHLELQPLKEVEISDIAIAQSPETPGLVTLTYQSNHEH